MLANVDIKNRATKLYKNKKNGFEFLLKEMLSNAMHSCIISKNENPKVTIDIQHTQSDVKLVITDNGDGFTDENYNNFKILDKENEIKRNNGFQSFGQGRLVLFYFSDTNKYESLYKEGNIVYKRVFTYPVDENTLFADDSKEVAQDDAQTNTSVQIHLKSDYKLERARTFFNKYDTIEAIKNYILLNFFPLLTSVEIELIYNQDSDSISKITSNDYVSKPFDLKIGDKNYNFSLYLLNSDKSDYNVQCFAKGILCSLSDKNKLCYDLKINRALYLTSDYFNENIDLIGEKIECDTETVGNIQNKIKEILDIEFQDTIASNRKKNVEKINTFKTTRPSFKDFVNLNIDNVNNELSEDDIQQNASTNKIEAEIKYWNGENTEYNDKLVKSSLFIYLKHREKILEKFKNDFLNHQQDNGDKKKENESTVHDILFKRSKEIYDNANDDVYFNHNLWLIDDKFSLFKNAKSTVNGQNASDVYLYCDNDNADEIVIIELKSTHNAHNKNDMIKQINQYAVDTYNQKNNILQGCITNTTKCRYYGYIIASQEDIQGIFNDATMNGTVLSKIPFLDNSYYINSKFQPKDGILVDIKIELISYKDLYYIANKRNEPIIKLMYKDCNKS